ncbi:MAG TPA: hypothetical protein VNO43_03390 [Candidatus Eisenbacteria bacterium]|nr:hypothetical protein [Candidatus Eisenbacteria bacterium]
MKPNGASGAGESRTCPHCKATILKSSVFCPLCRHVLRFAPHGGASVAQPKACALLVEGTIGQADNEETVEYVILMDVYDQNGKLISRQSVGVGALQQMEKRRFSLRVELSPARAAV